MSKSAEPVTLLSWTWLARAESFASPNALRASSTAFNQLCTSWVEAAADTSAAQITAALNMGQRVNDRYPRGPPRRKKRRDAHRQQHGQESRFVRERIELHVDRRPVRG